MERETVRVRFAPSPTGFMHLGNVRAALLNFLFARQSKGSFILRIEDTDSQRNVDPGGAQIIEDLAWLHLSYDEGPGIGGPYGPYMQSQRAKYYEEYLGKLQEKKLVYPCFCTAEVLEKKRLRQQALKLPPRYDRACLRLTEAERNDLLERKTPFMWRFKLEEEIVVVQDMGRGALTYDLKHFSDFALSRPDGSFTFLFANFVDDLLMKITHIIRGQDHLSNTALQAALYRAFDEPIPIFWHLPIICNSLGKKLSKRDFGFSLTDLRLAGFLPEAIDNYLAIIGGSFEHEIMDLATLAQTYNFSHAATAGPIKYDLEKLRWVNHKWLARLSYDDLLERYLPLLRHAYHDVLESVSPEKLKQLIELVRSDIVVLHDVVPALAFYFRKPHVLPAQLKEMKPALIDSIAEGLTNAGAQFDIDQFLVFVKANCALKGISPKDLFGALRLALTGTGHGLGVKELLGALGSEEAFARLAQFVNQAREAHQA